MEFLVAYKDQIVMVATFFTLPFFVFIVSLGFVYLVGRMWGLITNNRPKNILAFVVMVSVYLFYFTMVDHDLSVVQRVWYGLIYAGCSIILYVNIGFKLYERLDRLQDKKIGDDEPEVKEPKPKKRTTRRA